MRARVRGSSWFFTLIVAAALTDASLGTEAALRFDKTEIASDNVEQGVDFRTKVAFRNHGATIRKVENVRSTCKCLSATVNKTTLMPGEEGLLEVTASSLVVGKSSFKVYLSTDDGTVQFVTFKYSVVASYAIDPTPVTLVLDGSAQPCETIRVLYIGALPKKMPLAAVLTSDSSLQVKVLKSDWTSEETPDASVDPLQRAPLGVVECRHLGEFPERPGGPPKYADLSFVFQGADGATLVKKTPVLIRSVPLARIYPKPLVAWARKDLGEYREETIFVESQRPSDVVEGVTLDATEPEHYVNARVERLEDGRFALKVSLKPHGASVLEETGILRGRITARLRSRSHTHTEDIRFLFIGQRFTQGETGSVENAATRLQ